MKNLFLHKNSFAKLVGALAVVLICSQSHAAIEIHEFKSDVDRIRYEQFIEEMRCPKCQNQNLSGSDSPLAADLRLEIFSQIDEGRSDKEIVDFMVERYGEFVLYKPRLGMNTLFLWGFPALLLLLAIIGLIVWVVRRRAAQQPEGLSSAESARLAALVASLDEARANVSRNSSDTDNLK